MDGYQSNSNSTPMSSIKIHFLFIYSSGKEFNFPNNKGMLKTLLNYIIELDQSRSSGSP